MTFLSLSRPAWLDALAAFAVGFAGQSIILVGLQARAGLSGPVLDLIAPGLVGALAGFVVPRGMALGTLAIGMVLAYQAGPSIGGPPVADLVTIALAVAAAAVGFAVAWGARLSQSAWMPRPQSSAELAKVEAELNGELRTLDPNAPGTFERASALLRQASEQRHRPTVRSRRTLASAPSS
ncbi:MAG: hypothetical protein L0221_02440 [Chloroflexi bacterium]|nr:hypothetical protein [Chloroflexota bacterium]